MCFEGLIMYFVENTVANTNTYDREQILLPSYPRRHYSIFKLVSRLLQGNSPFD